MDLSKIMRLFDIFFAAFALMLLSPVLLIILIISYFDTGSPLFFQRRVGRSQKIFTLVKFRTMCVGTPSVGTHLVDSSTITNFGLFLRRTKLDELPQLWNVLKGEMSLVGPRPCLPLQKELINARENLNVYRYRAGITGLAQINGVDMSTPLKLATLDSEMLNSLTFTKYLYYIIITAMGKGSGDKVNLEK